MAENSEDITESDVYCVESNCPNPATGSRPLGMSGNGTPIVELVCDNHTLGNSDD